MLNMIYATLVAAIFGVVTGYVWRGDCAKEVRATEATATAAATVTAETIVSSVRLKDVHVTNRFGDLYIELAAAPTAETIPAGCPARVLSDLELRVWNAGNQDGHHSLQPNGTDFARPVPAPAGDEGREGSGEESPPSDGRVLPPQGPA